MEAKLAEFRRRHGQKNTSGQWREMFAALASRSPFSSSAPCQTTTDESKYQGEDEEEKTKVSSGTSRQVLVMKMLVWLTLLVIFVRLEFALIYLIISLLYLIWSSLGSGAGRRRRDQLSAYSVFNPNLEKIPGTFSGEEYDRQLRHGGGTPLSF